MTNQVITQVHTVGGGCFVAEVFDMAEGWEEKVRAYVESKKSVMDCSHVMMYISGTNRRRRIDL